MEYARKLQSPNTTVSTIPAIARPAELVGAEVTDDRGVDEQVERFRRERPERGNGEAGDLPVVWTPTQPRHHREDDTSESVTPSCDDRPRWNRHPLLSDSPMRPADSRLPPAAQDWKPRRSAAHPGSRAPRGRFAAIRVALWSRCSSGAGRSREVAADMVEGVLVANGVEGEARVRLRAAFREAIAAEAAGRVAA